MTAIYYIAITSFLFLCAFLCFVILLQESKSSGLGASFGGGDAGESIFGTSTADVLKKFTAYLAAIFLILCVFLSLWTSAMGRAKTRVSPPVIEEQQLPQ